MSAQNRYLISCKSTDASEWDDVDDLWPGDTWQDAIRRWIDEYWVEDMSGVYQSMSETPLEDGRSGILEIRGHSPGSVLDVNIQATLIKDD